MIEKPYFVILNHPSGDFLPLINDDGLSLSMYESEHEAMQAGNENPLGGAYGFEVFEIGDGK